MQILAYVSYGFLLASLLSLWVKKNPWIWGSLLVISLGIGLQKNVVDLPVLVLIAVLVLTFILLTKELNQLWRLFLVMLAAILSAGLITHYIKGFYEYNWGTQHQNVFFLPRITLHYENPLLAICILGIYLDTLETWEQWKVFVKKSIVWALLAVVLFGVYIYFFKPVSWNPTFTLIAPKWLVYQLFFIIIPQEAFFRGFIQKEIESGLMNSFSSVLAVLISALLSTSLFFLYGFSLQNAVFLFFLNLLYGTIYAITHIIESSIFLHFILACVLFFGFS